MRTVRELRNGAPGGYVAREDLGRDEIGYVWVRLDAQVFQDEEPPHESVRLRRNFELVFLPKGIANGAKDVIEVPAEDLRDVELTGVGAPDPDEWGQVTLWTPWEHGWTIR